MHKKTAALTVHTADGKVGDEATVILYGNCSIFSV